MERWFLPVGVRPAERLFEQAFICNISQARRVL